MADNVLTTISEFVENAKAARGDHGRIERCTDAALKDLATLGVDKGSAVHMLTTGGHQLFNGPRD